MGISDDLSRFTGLDNFGGFYLWQSNHGNGMPQDHEWTIALNKWFTLSVGLAQYRILPAWGVHKILHFFSSNVDVGLPRIFFRLLASNKSFRIPKPKLKMFNQCLKVAQTHWLLGVNIPNAWCWRQSPQRIGDVSCRRGNPERPELVPSTLFVPGRQLGVWKS